MPGRVAVKVRRSLYQCFNAKVRIDTLVCAKGHKFCSRDGQLSGIELLARGFPLEYKVCQNCDDYDGGGGFKKPIPKEERGWNGKE